MQKRRNAGMQERNAAMQQCSNAETPECRKPLQGGVRVQNGPSALLRFCILALSMSALWFASVSAARADEVIDRVLAVAGGDVITLSDVRAARELGRGESWSAPDPVRAVLGQLIDRALVLAEVNRFAPPEPTAQAVAAALDIVASRFATTPAFDAALARLGIDRPFVRDLLREDLRIRAYLDQRFTADTPGGQRILVDQWVAGLRRRSDVVDLYEPADVSGPPLGTAGPARD